MKTTDANLEPAVFPVIAWTHRADNGRPQYVRDEQHKDARAGRYDWEWTDQMSEAKPLSRYWWRRFRADRHALNQCAHWEYVLGGKQ